jgi:hypothetical protein
MDASERPGDINHDRRRFLGAAGAAALAVDATQLGMIGSAKAQTSRAGSAGSAGLATAGLAAASTAFGPVKQINAGVLNVGYVEAGPANGRAGHSHARFPLRHPQLRRGRTAAGG